MPNWVTVRGSGHITAVDSDGEEPRIYLRLKADMCAKVRSPLANYDYPPDLEERAIELVLLKTELFAHEQLEA
ncbi:MAG: hypothetical protein JRN15_11185 [Nitrososphaerota archaeon]|nr:hypothetical protein [Nitrososphaerota archaeon]